MKLKKSQIEFIIRDLRKRGLIYQPLHDEIVDHVCSLIEAEMEYGMRFKEAYMKALKEFGPKNELDRIQQHIINNNYSNPKNMIKNYFKIAFRNLKKHKFYGIINVVGLSIGIACTLLITLYILDETSYDKFNINGDRIYRVISHLKFGGNDSRFAVCPAPMAKAIRDEIPEVENSARFRTWGTFLVRKDKENIKEYNVVWADPEVFDLFTIPLIEGNPKSILRDPNTMVISESTAKKYFGDEDPMNQILTLNNDMVYKVTGVYKDIPHNSHFHFNMMLAMDGLKESKNDMWLSNNFQTYFLLRKGSDPLAAQKKINDLIYKYAGPQVIQFLGKTIDELIQQGTLLEEIVQPLYDIHLHSNNLVEFEPNGDIRYLYIFSAVALFILILAVINFMNLSTARSADRAREVGIRKVMGSYRRYLVEQFMTESVLISLFSVLFAVILANLLMPYFNSLTGKALHFPNGQWIFWILIIAAGIVIGILAGTYPSLFLSSFKPITTLSGKISKGSRNSVIRSTLVVFQFTISIILIIGTIAVYNQLNFIQHYKLGYNKDQVITLNDTYTLGNQVQSFKNEVLKDPDIISGTVSSFLPVSNSSRSNTTYWKKGDRSAQSSVNMQSWSVDYDYIKTLGMQIVEGRDFSRDYPSDSMGIILNEHAAKLFGFKDPIGQEIQVFSSTPDNSIEEDNKNTYHIIGVVKDFNWESLHENIGSLCMYIGDDNSKVSFRFKAGNTADVIHSIQQKWREMNPNQPISYSFMDENFANMYRTETKTGKIFTTFAALAIIIACLGLFALAAFMAEQRTKEIGVRKVMGATIGNIIFLLTKDFTKLVIIAMILSIPVAWYGIHLWLEGFVYKDMPGVLLFAGAGFGSLVIAWLTVSYQSFKAATVNPAKSLRDE